MAENAFGFDVDALCDGQLKRVYVSDVQWERTASSLELLNFTSFRSPQQQLAVAFCTGPFARDLLVGLPPGGGKTMVGILAALTLKFDELAATVNSCQAGIKALLKRG